MHNSVSGLPVILIHPTLIDQGREVSNLLMPKHHLQLRSQTDLKLRTLGPLVRIHLIVGAIFCKLFKLCGILSHRHSPLLQSQEFYLFFPFQVSMEVLLEEPSFKRFPSNCSSFHLHLSPSILPPVFGFLCQHVGRIG
ncbi:hypothetical protein Lalb_Chr06g0172141 [Lupinus albus]|uniref:Uncharacterized protein n=1 Tax=Lupinus albus TaxID=3870 RepID=A0A6A4QFV6_LUPAL|nr:hypothetical protein Lalb_Chr06g0172141 [Lupinus albus]